MEGKSLTLKRITRDLKEIQNNPIEGVGICLMNDNDLFQYLVNIQIQDGPYSGFIVHMMLFLPKEYPCLPPRMLIMPGQVYDHAFHHHIYPDFHGYSRFCIDMLDGAIMNPNAASSGWSPAYTFSTLMMQMQNFLADPDFYSKSEELQPAEIQSRLSKMKSYKYEHVVNGKDVVHQDSIPFPPLAKKKLATSNVSNEFHERLTCFLTKESFISNPTGVFGYPIHAVKDKYGRLQQKPIPEILSYEAFQSQQGSSRGTHRGGAIDLKTGNGELYNSFLPIYINNAHFALSVKQLGPCLSQISSETHFEKQVLNVLPNLINKQLVALLAGSTHQSIAAIEAYVQFTQLFHKLIRENKALSKDIDSIVESMISGDYKRNKKQLGDIGEFLVILSGSSYARTPAIIDLLYREYFARQIMWIPKNDAINQYRKSKTPKEKLEAVFRAALISNKLLIFNLEAAQRFTDQFEYLDHLSSACYSVIPQKDAQEFIVQMKNKINSIQNHVDLMKYLGLSHKYQTEEDCWELFKIAIAVSNTQQYSNFGLELIASKKPVSIEELCLTRSEKASNLKVGDLVNKYTYLLDMKEKLLALEKKEEKSEKPTTIPSAAKSTKDESAKNSKVAAASADDGWNVVSDKKKQHDSDSEEEVPQKKVIQKPAPAAVSAKKPQQAEKPKEVPVPAKPVKVLATKNDVNDDGWNVVPNKKTTVSQADEWNVVPKKKTTVSQADEWNVVPKKKTTVSQADEWNVIPNKKK